MNFFSSDAFLNALEGAFFSGRGVVKGLVADEAGRQYRVLLLNGKDPFHDHFLLDFLEPAQPWEIGSDASPGRPEFLASRGSVLSDAADEAKWSGGVSVLQHPRVHFLARTANHAFAVKDYDPTVHLSPAPFIRWADFEDWSAFEGDLGRRNKKLVSDTRRQRGRLEREMGPLEFEFQAADSRDALRQTMEWKSRKYRATLHKDIFADPRVRMVLESLLDAGAITVSTLRVGGALVATHVGVRWRGRFYYWLPAHDEAMQKYSPGKILLDSLLRKSFADGDAEFDFLIGGEDYKFNYATHFRLVEASGTLDRFSSLKALAMAKLKSFLKRREWTLQLARKFERRLQKGAP